MAFEIIFGVSVVNAYFIYKENYDTSRTTMLQFRESLLRSLLLGAPYETLKPGPIERSTNQTKRKLADHKLKEQDGSTGLVLNIQKENVEKESVEKFIGKCRRGRSIHRKCRERLCPMKKMIQRKMPKGKDRSVKHRQELLLLLMYICKSLKYSTK